MVALSRFSARLLPALLLCAALVAACGAVTITQSPSVIHRGEQIHVGIQDLRDGATFSLLIEGRFAVTPGGPFAFITRQFAMPITLEQGEISAYTENTVWTGLSVKKGNTTVSLSKDSENGIMSHTESYKVNAGTYDYLKLEGDALAGRDQILSKLTLKGTKKGPDDSQLSFTIDGIDAGTVRILITVDGSLALNKEVIVGTPVTTTHATASPTGPSVATFTSADRRVSVEASGVDYLGILREDILGAPAGWEVVAGPYTLSPPGVALGAPGTLRITVPEEVLRAHDPATLGIARYRDGGWEVIPSRLEGAMLIADITDSGTYAVVARIPGTTPTTSPWRMGWEGSFLLAAGALGAAALFRGRAGRRGGM
ncbi:MAG: hypothetical protein LUQ41_09210 [Methanomicrobiales archaeon]|nr:hypothetical protein [Methanomicrobiales archaeon]